MALFDDYRLVSASGLFDAAFYLTTNPELAALSVDPLVHYLEEGARAGCNPHPEFDAVFYLEQCRRLGENPENPLLHFIRVGAARGLRPSPQANGTPAADALAKLGLSVSRHFIATIDRIAVSSGANGDGRKLSGEGWAVATEPIVELIVSLGELGSTVARYGLLRADVAQTFPQYRHADCSGFAFSLEALPEGWEAVTELVVNATTADGKQHWASCAVRIAAEALDAEQTSALAEPPSMQLFVDQASVDKEGLLRVIGWAVSLMPIMAVEVLLDDERVGTADYGGLREDIAASYPDYPNADRSGFVLIADVSRYAAGRRALRVHAISRGGISRDAVIPITLSSLPRQGGEGQDEFRSHCDEIWLGADGELFVKGWAIGPAPTKAIAVLFDGVAAGDADIGIERPDVGNHYPTIAHGRRAGFAFRGRVGGEFVGEHRVVLRVLIGDVAHEILLPVVATPLPDLSDGVSVRVDGELKLFLDAPSLSGGSMMTPVRGSLEILGWAVARAGVEAIDIAIDGIRISSAFHGIRRPDVQNAFPEWDGALTSGFAALLPYRVLPKGRHTVGLSLRDKAGALDEIEFRMDVAEVAETSGPWSLRRNLPRAEREMKLGGLARAGWHPLFFLLLGVGGDPEGLRRALLTLTALRAQAWPNWRLLVLLHGQPLGAKSIRQQVLARFDDLTDRVRIMSAREGRRIADLLPPTAGPDQPVWCGPLMPGDELGCDALLEFAMAMVVQREADFLYADERRPNPATGAVEAWFKPQWSPDLLLSTNYIGRPWCARADLLASTKATVDELLTWGEYDLVLRCTEAAAAIRHVPALLCERVAALTEERKGEREALERAMVRRGIAGEIRPGRAPGSWRLKRRTAARGLVSIVIPTCAAGGLIKTCIATLRERTEYRNFEIVCVENIPSRERRWKRWLARHADKVVSCRGPFNWSRFNNLAAAKTVGEVLLFLNDDVEIVEPDWLDALLEHGERTEVGVVGPQLLYPDGRVQHAGMFLAGMGQGRHAFRYAAEDDPGYFGLALTTRNVIAVTGACLMTRRETFDGLGGFDEAHGVVNNDVDYCLRAWQSGRINIYTPHARLVHYEAVSRSSMAESYDAALFESKWRGLFLAGDPYFHPRLARDRDDFSVDAEPVEALCAGGPAFAREEIGSILVLKLDHIGDCIIAFPAVRRLKLHFPRARILVLASRASKPVWAMEPCVDGVIEFDFFHARSASGQTKLLEEDWEDLRRRLSEHRFDLAIDLRKHPETRPVLQQTGARLVAGFDHRGRFPWLDIAVEWDGDAAYLRKRRHTADDLVNLVEAVAAAGQAEGKVVAEAPLTALPAGLEAWRSPGRPLVCVHPAAGNETKQWPLEYFAVLIDRLVAESGAQIVLIGAPVDAEIADAILRRVDRPDMIWSAVGGLPLGELPALLAGCALFVGNDSGPKHIAAALGIPTVGIHSGVVDVREWGPVGPTALAIARDMACSPCYLTKVEDCPRSLACLRQIMPGEVYRSCAQLLAIGAQAGLAPAGVPASAVATRR